ncbi:MAG: phosphoribosylglycinamide formyltransferase [Micrococcaceae bacterium]
MRICVMISGVGSTMEALIKAVENKELNLDIAAVVSDKNAAGLKIAQEHSIPTIVVSQNQYPNREEWCEALLQRVQATGAQLVVLAGFMKILTKNFVTSIPTLNTHPSLLPAFPGAHGIKDALDYGVKISGATAHWVDVGVDTGPILAQVPVKVKKHDTQDSLKARIQEEEKVQYVKVLRAIVSGKTPLPF